MRSAYTLDDENLSKELLKGPLLGPPYMTSCSAKNCSSDQTMPPCEDIDVTPMLPPEGIKDVQNNFRNDVEHVRNSSKSLAFLDVNTGPNTRPTQPPGPPTPKTPSKGSSKGQKRKRKRGPQTWSEHNILRECKRTRSKRPSMSQERLTYEKLGGRGTQGCVHT